MTLINSCKQPINSESSWRVLESETLQHNQLGFDDIIILNSKQILLFGDEDTDENFQKMQAQKNIYLTKFAVIYKTQNGGKTWEKKTFEKGGFWHTSHIGNTIYATKVVNNGRLAELSSILYRSTDNGDNWEKVNEFIGQAVIIMLNEQTDGYIAGLKADSSQRNPAVYEIENGQIKKQVKELSHPATWKHESNEILFMKQSHSSNIKDLFCVFDTELKKLKEYRLPEGLNGYYADKSENKYWVIGGNGNQCYLYVKDKDFDFKCVQQFNVNGEVFPKCLKVFGNRIVVVIGKVTGAGTVNATFFSSDGGSTWIEEKLLKPQYLNPVDFINTEQGIFGIGFSGSGRVQVIEKMK